MLLKPGKMKPLISKRILERRGSRESAQSIPDCRTPLCTLKAAHTLLLNFNRLSMSMSMYNTEIMAMKPGLNPNIPINPNTPVEESIEKVKLEGVQESTFLGVIIDQNMNWKPSISC